MRFQRKNENFTFLPKFTVIEEKIDNNTLALFIFRE